MVNIILMVVIIVIKGFFFKSFLTLKIQEICFKFLDAPVMTIGSENMPAIPLNSTLEQAMIPSTEKVKKKISEILRY